MTSNPDDHARAGRELLFAGDVDGAVAAFERAIAIEPGNAWYHWCLVDARGGDIGAAHLAQLEQLAVQIDALPEVRQIDLAFALAAALERARRSDDALRYLHAGNALQRRRIAYDELAQMRFIASLEALCSASFVSALAGGGDPSERPIFVFGLPRSGTTLVEQLLAAHPAVAGGGEIDALERAIHGELMTPGMTLAALPERLRAMAAHYLAATAPLAGSAARLTDKMPHNGYYAPLIHLAFPNARMIHVRRDLVDTCFSCYATIFNGTNIPYAYDLGELGRFAAAHERLLARWRALLPPERFIEVEYERLVGDPEAESRRLVAACGLPWDAAVLDVPNARRTVRTASAAQVRRPIYRDAIGRGRRVAAQLGPLLEALGERPSDPRQS